MSKRTADRQITQDFLDHEDEPEDAGQFEKATECELEGRVFKKARRTRLRDGSSDQSDSSRGGGLFSGIRLTGSLTQQNGLSTQQPKLVALPPPSLSVNFNPSGVSNSVGTTLVGSSQTSTLSTKPTFLSELRSLNTSVNDWIGKHVRENPYVDLTPIFRDYEKHLKELDAKFSSSGSQNSVEERSEVVAVSNTTVGEKKEEEKEKEEEVVVTAGPSQENEEKADEGRGGGEEEGVKNEQKDTPTADKEEKESLHSVRAKLYFKRSTGTEFTELGLGQLRVLPCGGGDDSVKVVMRNDTSLAKVLLNVKVTNSIPVSVNKNNVLLVTIPNPPLPQKSGEAVNEEAPVTYLIRVKNVTKATELKNALQSSSDN